MQQKFDILIIGSGLGGLVSAVILAKKGLKVCVLEKNSQFGGNLQTFSRNKRIFDTGVHYLGGLEPGQNLYRYFDFLGIMQNLKISRMSESGFDRISFDGDEKVYPHSQGYENFVEDLAALFPAEKENIEKYILEIQRICNNFSRYNLGEKQRYDENLLYENTADFIESITDDNKLQAVLCGSNFLYAGNRKTPLYVHALTVNSYIRSAYRCIDGGSQIAKLLVKELRKHGGEIRRRSKVTEISYAKDGLIQEIRTESGKKYEARNVISNIDIKATIKLFGKENFSKALVKRVEQMLPGASCFSVYIILRPQSVPYFNYNIFHCKSPELIFSTSEADSRNWPAQYMLSAAVDQRHPEFAESLTILTYMSFDEVEKWAKTENTVAEKNFRGTDYDHFKEERANTLIAEIEKKIPGIRNKIDQIYTSTPLTYRDYIGTDRGAMYGYEKDSNNPLKTMFVPKTKIPNLFLTGQSVNMHGILGVTIGAFTTCTEILGEGPMENPQ